MTDVIEITSKRKKASGSSAQDDYLAASPPSSEPLATLQLIMSTRWMESFWYADLRRVSFRIDSHFGENPVLILTFSSPGITEVIVQGVNLHRLYDDLLNHRIAWLCRAGGIDPDSLGTNVTAIQKISFHS
jgi:hypothetical protein